MTNQVSYETTRHVRDHCLCLAAQRTARALARQFDEAFRPLGLTNGQFSLLMALNRPEPPALGPVAELLAMDRTTLTAKLKPLQKRGLIELRPAPSDGRIRLLVLTAAGQALLAEALPVWESEHAKIDNELTGINPGVFRAALSYLA